MNKRFFRYLGMALTAVPCAFLLTACDMPFGGGGDKQDVSLYHLTFSSNIDLGDKSFNAKLAYGERHDIFTRPQDEVEQFLSDGATQTDIDKTNVRQSDGSYYYFDGDPIIIEAPEVDGYIFIGFFDKKTNDVYRPIISKCQLSDGSEEMLMNRWNMPERDTELVARYQLLEYDIVYCYGFDKSYDATGAALPSGVMPTSAHSNPTKYNYQDKKDVTLTAPTAQFTGYEFEYWYYAEQGTGKEIKVETLPTKYSDEVLHGTFSLDGITDSCLTLFAHYKELTVTPTIVYKEGNNVLDNIDNCISITATDTAGNPVSKATSYACGTKLDVFVDLAELDAAGYELEGIYIDGVKIPNIDLGGGSFRPCNRTDVDLLKDTLIEIKVTLKKCEVYFDITGMDGVSELIIVGEGTTVDGELAYPDGIACTGTEQVITEALSNLVVKFKLNSGYAVTEHSIDYEPVDVSQVGEYYVCTFQILHEYMTISLHFEAAE